MILLASLPLSSDDLRQLRRARAVGFTKAAIRRALVLDDASFLPEALQMLEVA